jgi:hypothetical protein
MLLTVTVVVEGVAAGGAVLAGMLVGDAWVAAA